MNSKLPEPAPELTEKVALQAETIPARVFSIQHGQRRLVIKQSAPQGRGQLQAWLVGWLCRHLTGQRPARDVLLLPGGQTQLEFEARRLKTLRRAGERVPAVYAVGDGWLALEDVGQELERKVRRLPPAQAEALLIQLATELAEFHRAGHWHGGSQIRNLTVRDGRFYRIDFEEDLSGLPLPLIQAFDLTLFLSSCVRYLRGDTVAAGMRLLKAYFRVHPVAEIKLFLRQGYALLRWLQPPLRLLGRRAGKDGERVRLLLEILGGFSLK